MKRSVQELDRVSRRLVRGVEKTLRDHLGPGEVDRELVGDLYLRIRGVLAGSGKKSDAGSSSANGILDDLAIAVYMATVARKSGDWSPPDLIVSLRETIRAALQETGGETQVKVRNERESE